MFKYLIIILISLTVSGCMKTKQQVLSNNHLECSSYGLNKGTTPYANCMLSLRQIDGTIKTLLNDLADSQDHQAELYGNYRQDVYQPDLIVICTSNQIGDTVYTYC